MTAPLTWKKLGSTRCVGCEKLFAATSDTPVTETEATDYAGGRRNYSANRPVRVRRRWHTECLADFERRNDEYRAECRADSLAMAESIREAIARTGESS